MKISLTRKPDIQSKTQNLTFIPLDDDERKITVAFKKLCIQDDATQHDFLLEALQLLFVKHNLDLGGNPQRQLLSFDTQQIIQVKCQCGRVAVKHGLHLASGVERDFCVRCFGELPGRHDPKVWRF